MVLVNKGICFPIVPVYAHIGPYPQNAVSINVKLPDTIIAEASLVLGVVLVNLERVPIVTIQPAPPRAKPHKPLPVLNNCPHIGLRQSIGQRQMGKVKTGVVEGWI